MFKFPNPRTKDPKERRIQRVLEIIPGTLTWVTIMGMFILSFLLPIWVAVFIIAFDVYWIFRTIFISYYSVVAYRRFKEGKSIDWWERCQNISDAGNYRAFLEKRLGDLKDARPGIWKARKRLAARREIRRLERYLGEVKKLAEIKDQIWDWRKVVHVVMLPTAGEDAEVIEPALEAIKESNFPNEQIIILLATEEREEEKHRLEKVAYLKKKFDGVFRDFLVTTHEVAAGELKCKASNATYAAKKLMVYLDERSIPYERVIFSNFDCDSVCHPQYFAALTYAYITDPKRLQRSYQPLPMYHNNLWDTNAFVRVIVTSSSFWHMYQSTRSEMVTFSSHSEPFATLVAVDFWPVNMISEDSIIYWKCFSYYGGDYMVKPIYLPVSLDAVLAQSYWKTIRNQYKQKRRWAYGIENFPVIMRALWGDKRIALSKKLSVAFEMLEGHHSWATSALILALLGWLPLIFGGAQFNASVLAHNLPLVTGTLMKLALVGLIVSMSLSFTLLPPKPARYPRSRYLYMLLQWLLVPVITPTLGSLPAIDSQTRILLGKYFGEFWVTEKVRK
ncbi:MAG TPA: glycosyltransferase family 2 protein [Candidatus Moranbacteria bacterium]|nr:glycosyltransferase family 2 protein [Candidatus Moranbacteria bacterium]